MNILLPALLLAPLSLPLGGCSCGFDCHDKHGNNIGGGGTGKTVLTLGLSDSLPEDLKQVNLEVNTITFKRSGAADVVVETFSSEGGATAQSFHVNLLDFQGDAQLVVIKNLELDPGTYTISITILQDTINNSNVVDANDVQKALTATDGVITLPSVSFASGNQAYTVEFGLAQALQFQSTSDTYLLATNGIRIENNNTDATLSGKVDTALFDLVPACSTKGTPTEGNRIYLYKGINLTQGLTDVSTSASVPQAPGNLLAPFAVASLDATAGTYEFGFLPPGDYTMAFSCNTADDDSVQWNNLAIPLPTNQVYELSLTAGSNICDLTQEATGCVTP